MDLTVTRWACTAPAVPGVVGIWLIDPARDRIDTSCLTGDERAEFDSGYDGPTRRVRSVARAALRHLLAARLDTTPARVPLRHTAAGKPLLAGATGVHISVSHTTACVALAVASGPVGVDVERTDLAPLRQAAPAFLHHTERAAPDRLLPFLWTGKEALAKAIGTGFSQHGPDEFAFTTVPGRRPLPRLVPGSNGEVSVAWLVPDQDHVVAVAQSVLHDGADYVERADPRVEPRVGEFVQQVRG